MSWVVVPSVGRAGKSPTIDALKRRANVMVATPEVEEYEDAYPWLTHVLRVPYGVGKARQAVLEHARSKGWAPFWMIDDDILTVYAREADGPKLHRTALIPMLDSMDEFIGRPVNVALAGPNWRQRAWSSPAVEEDRHVGAIVRVNPEAPITYPEHMGEDLAVVMQAILAGWHTMRLSLWAYTTPAPATVDGGCRADYAAGRMEEGILTLVNQYPDFLSPELSVSTGTMRAKVDWKLLDQVTAR